MPMDFPDLDSLKSAADIHKFREFREGIESEDEYRESLADHVETIDMIEGQEIRNKVGWDKFTSQQNINTLKRAMLIKK